MPRLMDVHDAVMRIHARAGHPTAEVCELQVEV